MSDSSTIALWELWAETVTEAQSVGDPLLVEYLEAVEISRIFEGLEDDKLKTSLSVINTLLNDPKTRPKGLTFLNELLQQTDASRLVAFQDSVVSALHLTVKGIDSPLASRVLVNFLPKCHSISEVNQCVTSSIVPKILTHFCDSSKTAAAHKSVDDLMLLKTCLQVYHGPCGQSRDKLEKVLVPLLDTTDAELIHVLSEVMPLLSSAGGGGNGGEKHSVDWNTMLTKVLKTSYSTLLRLYDDNSSLEEENNFEGDELSGLKRISEANVLIRMSLLKRRLQNLLSVISAYLSIPFPAPKLVPQKGILKLIWHLIFVNPVASQKPEIAMRKETSFLNGLVPGVHFHALKVLRSLILCVGTNVFIEAERVEQIMSNECKWLLERPRAFENLKCQLYELMIDWLAISGGIVTNIKTVGLWIKAVGHDTQIEKDIVELKILTKPKPGKSKNIRPLSSASTSTQTFKTKNSEVCQVALRALSSLVSSLDADNHKKVYEHLLKSIAIVTQFQHPPTPYDNPMCRQLLYHCLICLVHNPQLRSPISLPLILTMLRNGMQDSSRMVSKFCSRQISLIERLVHPISVTLSFPGDAVARINFNMEYEVSDMDTSRSNTNIVSEFERAADEELPPNDVPNAPEHVNEVVATSSRQDATPLNPDNLLTMIREVVEKTLRNALPLHISGRNDRVTSYSSPLLESRDTMRSSKQSVSSATPRSLKFNGFPEDVEDTPATAFEFSEEMNGNGNHEENDFVDVDNENVTDSNSVEMLSDEPDIPQTKKAKTNSPDKRVAHVEGPTVGEMLSSFVDLEAGS